MATKIINNFSGRLARNNIGDLNSGLAKYDTSFGYDPFSNITNLTWQETATQIDAAGSVITDLIMAGKERVESGISYVYAIGHTGRLYKIQVNDPAGYNPNLDTPVLLATLATGSPTFKRGGSIDFFGTTEQIYIGHDKGVTTIHFDGTTEAAVTGSWQQDVPRPLKQFLGKLYVGNGTNLAEIDVTALAISSSKLSPAFPLNAQVRDMDLNTSGTYLEIVVSRLALPDITSATQDTTLISNSDSYIFKWNGTDTGYTSVDTFPSFSLNANTMFGNYQYTFGYDTTGAAVFNPTYKILSPILSQAPLPNAVGSNGNLVAWATPEYSDGFLRMSNFLYGSLDSEFGTGWWRQFAQTATTPETDVIRVPFQLVISNFYIASSTNGYAGGVVGYGKAYFSTLETSNAPTTKYKFYKWFPVATTAGTAIQGVYETQNETFSKKFKIPEVRFYTEPLVANNSFKIDLIGSDGNPISGGTQTFTVGSNVVAGQDYVWYTPQTKPTYSVGIRITNLGSKNWVGIKLELDYEPAGR